MIDKKKGAFNHVESELYGYHDTRQELIRLRNELLHGSPEPNRTGGGRGNLPSDPTGSAGTALATDRRVLHYESILDAIEGVYEGLPPEKQRLIKLKYWTRPQTLTWEGIAQRLHISRKTAFNWRDEIVYSIAAKLGWH